MLLGLGRFRNVARVRALMLGRGKGKGKRRRERREGGEKKKRGKDLGSPREELGVGEGRRTEACEGDSSSRAQARAAPNQSGARGGTRDETTQELGRGKCPFYLFIQYHVETGVYTPCSHAFLK